jgi:hypothetical protein
MISDHRHTANVACIESYRNGIMKSVELMVPGPWFPEAVRLLNVNPGLDVGVHLVITSEWNNIKWRPLTCCPSLTDKDGYFYPFIWQREDYPEGTALKNASWKINEIEAEFRAQIEMAKKICATYQSPKLQHGLWELRSGIAVLHFRNLQKNMGLDIDTHRLGYKSISLWDEQDSTADQRINLLSG